jgi:hypothetical protein
MTVLHERCSGRPTGGRSGGRAFRNVAIALILVLILAAPVWYGSPAAARVLGLDGTHLTNDSNSPTLSMEESESGSLLVSNQSFALSTQFFGVNVHVVGLDNQSLAALANATPFVSFRFSPMGEATNQAESITYSPNGVPSAVYAQTDAQFVTWCRWISCRATMMVPAEIDNPSQAAATVRYVEQTLGFHPEYWAIGNEPQQWTHFGIPWVKWRASDESTPTPAQYAQVVRTYITAMRDVDPSIRIIGIESVVGGSLSGAWIQDTVQVNGPNLSAVAYHAYPLGSGSGPASLSAFYAALANPEAFPLNYPATTAIVRAACPSCHISVFLDELNAGLGGSYTSYMTSYPEVPFIASALIAAMNEDVSRVQFFDLEDLDGQQPYGMTTVGQGSRPSFLLYEDLLDHMASGSVTQTSIQGGPGGVYEVLTTNGSTTSLFVVNTNLALSLSLSLPKTGGVFSTPLTMYRWTSPDTLPSAPVRVTNPDGTVWKVSSQSLLLLVWNQG